MAWKNGCFFCFFFRKLFLKTTSAPSFNKKWRCENSLCGWKTAAEVPGPMERRFLKTAGRLGAKLLVFYMAFNGEILEDSKTKEGIGWMRFWRANWGPVLPLDATSKDHPIFPSRMRAVEHHQFSVRPWSDTNSPQRLKSTPTQTLEMIYPPILWRFSLVQPYQLREFFEKSREIWDSICFLMKRKYLDLLHPEKKKKTKNPLRIPSSLKCVYQQRPVVLYRMEGRSKKHRCLAQRPGAVGGSWWWKFMTPKA